MRIGSGCGLAQAVGILTGDEYSIVVESHTNGNPLLQLGAPAFSPIGIARQPGLSEGNQFCATRGRFHDFLAGTFEGFFSIEVYGRGLHHRNFDFLSSAKDLV